ncbi:MAG: hypothetical protein AAF490_16220 [Chloroflexota bacterium]
MRKKQKFSIGYYLFVILGSLVFAVIGIATVSSMGLTQGEGADVDVLALEGDSEVSRFERGTPPPWATKTPRGFVPTPTSDPYPYPDPPTPTPEPTEDPYPDPPTPTPEPTEDPYPYPEPSTPTPTADPFPAGTTFHVYDLDVYGSGTELINGRWTAGVIVKLETDSGYFLKDIAVEGYFSHQPNRPIRCESTGYNCGITSSPIRLNVNSVEFVVTNAEHNNPNTTYAPEFNYDIDGNSDGTTIIIEQPAPYPAPYP